MTNQQDLILAVKPIFGFWKSLLWRMLCICVLFYLLIHFEENPPVIVIAGMVLLLLFLAIGNDELVVYRDRLVHTNTSLFQLLFRKGGKVYDLTWVQEASILERTRPGAFDIGAIAILISLIGQKGSRGTRNTLFLDLTNGEQIRVTTDISNRRLRQVADAVNAAILRLKKKGL
ncbi:MAG TPA: hypothetical protein VG737_11410 [Cyclobacteriaceae bacterium]|nr:hypothetical protein [Cyclobacteriaceae bacterium]